MRCWVKSRNERNPCGQLPARNGGDSGQTAYASSEEGGDDVKSSWPLRPGLHTCYNGWYRGKLHREVMLIYKTILSSDWSLQLDSMKVESLVIADQLRRGEYVPGPCTHRPSSDGSQEYLMSACQPSGGSCLG